MQAYLKRTLRAVLDEFENAPDDFEPELETPANPEHGDLSTNTAMRLPRHLKRSPREIADDLAERLRERLDPERVKAVEVAGPGFVNFRFADDYLFSELAALLAAGDDYGRTKAHGGKTALVEYVSANPTGPLTVGHGRNAVLGDTLANLLEWTGYEVEREYYFNDAGRQMRVLAQSVQARYEAIVDPDAPTKTIESADGATETVPASFPDDGYRGEYIIDIARDLYDEKPDLPASDDLAPFQEAAEDAIFADIENTLDRLDIAMDAFFNERDLYDDGEVEAVLERLREADVTYEKDGATWLRTTDFGKDKDTVLVKSSGEPTYRLPDIAYHVDKCKRGFDHIVDVFGADHVATYPDVLSALDVLGHDTDRVSVLVYQFVTLVRGGEPVKMSTRAANYVTLDELMDEVPPDVVRFFFLMRSPNTHLDFDLELARERSEKNPVFYLQYAHARICSILDKAEEVGFSYEEEPELELLTHDAEKALIKELLRFPEAIRDAAETMAPHRLADYLRDVATAFTAFYGDCHIIGEERSLAVARMHLALAARSVLRNGLTVLGIGAPRSM